MFLAQKSQESFNVSGNLGAVKKGDALEVEGKWTVHPKFGKQFNGNNTDLDVDTPTSTKQLLELCKKAGITAKQFTDWIKNSSPDLHQNALKNPYILLDAFVTMEWDLADKLAQALNMMPDSEMRLSAGIRFSMRKGTGRALRADLEVSAGCWATPDAILPETADLLGMTKDELGAALAAKSPPSLTIIQQPTVAIMDTKLLKTEELIASKIKVLLENAISIIDQMPEFSDRLSDEQAEAVFMSMIQGASVITGKPGCGKTRSVAEVVRLLDLMETAVYLCAPTGKAAYRMAEVIRQYIPDYLPKYSTIHRLLGCKPSAIGGFTFEHDANTPLPQATYIVDESSMTDTAVFGALLAAIPKGSRLILVGDPNQIRPVGAGQPFHDLIDSGAIPINRLNKIFRQAEGSAIAQACEICLDGSAMDFFTFIRSPDAKKEIEYISVARDTDLLERIPALYRESGKDKILLTPQNKGNAGGDAINLYMQDAINKEGKYFEVYSNQGFRNGDPIIQIRNNYSRNTNKGIFNGDMGFAYVEYNAAAKALMLSGNFDAVLSKEYYAKQQALRELKLAYSISIHKSQGSEWKHVILVLPAECSRFLTRKLLYTAMSRAKGKLTILANPLAISGALSKKEADNPIKTRLGWLLSKQRLPEV